MTKLTLTLEDGTTRELPDGFPTTQGELDQIISNRLGPKSQRVAELERQVADLTTERDAATTQLTERDQKISQLETDVTDKTRELLVTTVANNKGVPAKWLRGEDEAALIASADEWLTDAKGVAPADPPAGGGEGGDNGQPGGHVPSAGSGAEDPPRPSFEEAKQRAYERAKNQRKGALA